MNKVYHLTITVTGRHTIITLENVDSLSTNNLIQKVNSNNYLFYIPKFMEQQFQNKYFLTSIQKPKSLMEKIIHVFLRSRKFNYPKTQRQTEISFIHNPHKKRKRNIILRLAAITIPYIPSVSQQLEKIILSSSFWKSLHDAQRIYLEIKTESFHYCHITQIYCYYQWSPQQQTLAIDTTETIYPSHK